MVIRFRNIVALLMGLIAQSIGAEGFERRRRGLTKRRIEPLDAGKTFPQFAAHRGGNLVERFKHVLLVGRGRFCAGNIVAVRSILRVKSEHEGFAEGSDAAGKDSLDPFPFTDFPGNLRGNGLVLLAAQELQTLAKVLLADNVEHGRLGKLHPERLVQSSVKYPVSGLVDEVSDDDAVL